MVDEMEVIPMELKYCERCGALFLRPREMEEPYCPSCEVEVAELPSPSLKSSRAHMTRARKVDVDAEGEEVVLAYSEGGQA